LPFQRVDRTANDGVPLRGVADHVLGTRRSSPYRRGPGMSTALTAGQLRATRMPCPTVRPMHGLPERVEQGRLHHEAGHDPANVVETLDPAHRSEPGVGLRGGLKGQLTRTRRTFQRFRRRV
jgi:hypothetical protein